MQLPPFSIEDMGGETYSNTSGLGRAQWLILARFAACPFCSLRLKRLIDRWDLMSKRNVEVTVVFPSRRKRVERYIRKYEPPFRVVADPEQQLFELFGSETNWLGELKTAANLPKVMRALAQARMNPLAVDDAVHRMPSEYLVQSDGTIGRVHYGEELDDGFEVETVATWLDTQ